MTFGDSLRFGGRWWWLLLSGMLLAAGLTYLVTVRLPRVYEARATLLVGPVAGVGLAPGLITDGLTATYAELIATQPVVASVAAATGLNAEDLKSGLLVTPVRDTHFIQLRFRSIDPQQAAAVTNLAANTAIQQLQAERSARLALVVDRVSTVVNQLAQEVADRTARVDLLSGQSATLQRDVQLAAAQTDLTRAQQRYSAALASLDDARVAQANAGDVLTLPEPAVDPTEAVLPQVAVDVFSAAVVGLLLALLIGLLVDLLAERPASSTEMATKAGIGVVSELPPLRDPLSEVAFGQLRVLLRPTLGEPPYGVVLVTSAATGEGKTTVAAGLAAAFARAAERVILVDANLRQPRLAEVFSTDASRGLTTLLTNQNAVAERQLQTTDIDGLSLLAAGPTAANGADLVASRGMQLRLRELRDLADLVIVDAPSLELSDPLALLPEGGGVLLVIDPRCSSARAISQTADRVHAGGGRVLALVVNHGSVGAAKRAVRPSRELAAAGAVAKPSS